MNDSDIGRYTHVTKDFPSSNIEAFYYDEVTCTLYVCFLSGSIIGYQDVGIATFNLLSSSKSKGSAYNAYVRGKFKGLGVDIGYDDLWLRWSKMSAKPNVLENATNFVIKGTAPVEQTIIALNLPDAVAKFLEDNEGAVVTEVTIKIV